MEPMGHFQDCVTQGRMNKKSRMAAHPLNNPSHFHPQVDRRALRTILSWNPSSFLLLYFIPNCSILTVFNAVILRGFLLTQSTTDL